jgi:hypothetical protein
MTIDHRIGRFAGGALALAAWGLIMLAMPMIGPPGRLVAVIGDDPRTVVTIASAGGRVVEVKQGVTLARGGPGFARALYSAGAPLVLEGRIAARCFQPAGRVSAGA